MDWHGKCNPDELLRGSYEISAGKGGTYALVFDNTFSKNTSKTVHFSQRVVTADNSSLDSVSQEANSTTKPRSTSEVVATKGVNSASLQPSCFSDGRHLTGVMLKKRRKKLQGYARRYFSLDYKYGTLNYFTAQNSSILRGSMPIKLCVVSARETTRDIYIDSGMEVWNVKPLNSTDFKTWVAALEVARLGASAIAHSSPQNYSDNLLSSMAPGPVATRLSAMLAGGSAMTQDSTNRHLPEKLSIWERMEVLVNRLESTAFKASQEVGLLEKKENEGSTSSDTLASKGNGPGPQRRASFWKRKSSRQSVTLLPSPSSNSSSQELGPTDVPPPLPLSPLLPQTFSDASLETISKLNLKEPCVSSASNVVLKQVSKELQDVLADFKLLLQESKKSQGLLFSANRRGSMDEASMFSEEFFDAEEFDNPDGVVYLGHESGSEDELIAEDDSPSDDEIGAFPSSTSCLPIPVVPKPVTDEEALDLYPLSILSDNVKHRKTVPMAVAAPPNFLTIIRKNVGKDMSSVAMPVTANEPLNILQRFTEMFEHTRLIDTALTFPDKSPERIMYIAAFAAVFISSAKVKERSGRKPFNPLLGETFELVRKDQGLRLITEKVSHRPPVMAMQAESAGWTLHYSPSPQQQIWGKSVELNNKGPLRLSITSTGEVYEWKQPTTFLRNIIAGEKYSEPVGSITVSCSNGWRSVIEYKAGGMFSGRSEELKGKVISPDGHEKAGYLLDGKWTTSIEMITPSSNKTIWETGPLIDGHGKRFGFTQFAATLNEITEVERGLMAPTDTRLRPDQRMYENGDCDTAEAKKLELEQEQRVRRSELESLGESYKPVFFELDDKSNLWKLKKGADNYWERRKRQDWKGVQLLF